MTLDITNVAACCPLGPLTDTLDAHLPSLRDVHITMRSCGGMHTYPSIAAFRCSLGQDARQWHLAVRVVAPVDSRTLMMLMPHANLVRRAAFLHCVYYIYLCIVAD